MQEFNICLSDEEYDSLNARFPEKGKSSHVGTRAIEILKIHFLRKDCKTTFRVETGDADLEIKDSKGNILSIEVKGTAGSHISWGTLKVSGTPSHDALVRGMPVYRVCGVEDKEVRVYVLTHGKDFRLVEEPRWRFAPGNQ